MSFLVIILYQSSTLFACTAFVVSNDEIILVGNNEDYTNPSTKIWFVPSREERYGCVFFGFDDYYPQGGMNDKGLFFDGFATVPLKVTQSVRKEKYNGNIIEKVMLDCATVEEVIAVFNKYNLEFLEEGMLFFADESGDSIIIEGDEFLRKKGHYQIITNFYQSKIEPGDIDCWRYLKVKEMLDENSDVSI